MILTLRGLQLVESRVRQQMDDEDALAASEGGTPLIVKALTVATGALVTAYALRRISGPLASWLEVEHPDVRDLPMVDRALKVLGINVDEWAGVVPETEAEEVTRSLQEPEALGGARHRELTLDLPERAPLPEQAAGAPARTEPAPITKPAKKSSTERAQDVGGLHSGVSQIRFLSDEERASFDILKANGERFRGGRGLTAETKRMIEAAARKHGVPVEWLRTMVQFESGGNPNAVSSTGAIGMGQFTGRTARSMGLTNRFDPEANIDATARLMVSNMDALKRANVKLEKQGKEPIPIDLTSVYLAHQMGESGTKELYNAANNGGTLSATTKKNMGYNLGVKSASAYIEANRAKMASAMRASQDTVATPYIASTPATTTPQSTTKVATTVPSAPPVPPRAQPEAPRATTRQPTAASSTPRPMTIAKAPETWFLTDDGVLVYAGD